MSLVWKELATEGPVGAVRKWTSQGMAVLVRAGREWEHEWEAEFAQPNRGRRVPLDDEGP
jgi:hypothetical protein